MASTKVMSSRGKGLGCCSCCGNVAALLQRHHEEIAAKLDRWTERQEVLLRSMCREQSQATTIRSDVVCKRSSQWSSRFIAIESENAERRKNQSDIARVSSVDDSEESDDEAAWQSRLSVVCFRVATSRAFDVFVITSILANAVLIGVDVQWQAENPAANPSLALEFLNLAFALFFWLELIIRIFAQGKSFCTSHERWWNLLDCTLVVCSAAEVMAVMYVLGMQPDNLDGFYDHLNDYRILRTLRFAQVVRLARLNRLLRFVTPLRLLVASILSTLWHLCCAMQLFLLTVFVFSVFFTRAGTELWVQFDELGDADMADRVLKHWRDLPHSMLTLFKCMSSGINWGEVVEPLTAAGPEILCVFLTFIAFSHLALLNVVTGVFCQVAIDNAQRQKDLKVRSILQSQNQLINTIEDLFSGMDSDGSGCITYRELKRHCQGQALTAFMATVDLEPHDLWQLFSLLDTDKSNSVDPQEFVLGCMRLRGPAKALELASLQMEHKILTRRIDDFMKYMEHRMDFLTGGWHSDTSGDSEGIGSSDLHGISSSGISSRIRCSTVPELQISGDS